ALASIVLSLPRFFMSYTVIPPRGVKAYHSGQCDWGEGRGPESSYTTLRRRSSAGVASPIPTSPAATLPAMAPNNPPAKPPMIQPPWYPSFASEMAPVVTPNVAPATAPATIHLWRSGRLG